MHNLEGEVHMRHPLMDAAGADDIDARARQRGEVTLGHATAYLDQEGFPVLSPLRVIAARFPLPFPPFSPSPLPPPGPKPLP